MQCWQVAACLCTLRLPSHASSWLLFPLPCLFKSEETLGRFVQKVIGPPAGTQRGPTCSLYGVLQIKLALGLVYPINYSNFLGVPKGPREGPKRPPRGLLAAMPPRGPQEVPHVIERPPRSQACDKRVTSVSGPVHFGTAQAGYA